MNKRDYSDMLDMARPVSGKHPPMSMIDRAAQFSPFAALTGYGDMVEEAAACSADPLIMDQMLDEGKAIYRSEMPEIL